MAGWDVTMGVELTEEEIKKSIIQEYDRRYPLARASMADLDCYNAVKKAQVKKFVEYLDGFKCDDCETPDFISLVLPKKVWQELNRLGVGYDDKCKV